MKNKISKLTNLISKFNFENKSLKKDLRDANQRTEIEIQNSARLKKKITNVS